MRAARNGPLHAMISSGGVGDADTEPEDRNEVAALLFARHLLNSTSMQTVDEILTVRPGHCLVRRKSTVGPLNGPADDRMRYRDRNRGVTLLRQPLLFALRNNGIALPVRHNIVPFVL